MSDKETTAAAKPTNKERAIEQVRSALSKYKIVKLPVLVNTVIKNVFGDTSKDEEKADKAYKLVSNLINEMVETGELSQFTFVRMTMQAGSDTPSIINESILVEGGFQLAGYVPANMESDSVIDTAVEDDDVFNETDVNEVIRDNAAGYCVVNSTSKERTIFIKETPQAALGKYLQLVAEDENEPEVFALMPVELTISAMMGNKVELVETQDDEQESVAS